MQNTVRVHREKYIGGSDIAAIMNLSPFKTRYKLLREKAGLEVDEFEGNIYTEYGNTMEPKIRDYINMTTGSLFTEGRHYAELTIDGEVQDDIEIRCHTDGENEDTILEIKTTSKTANGIDGYSSYLVQLLYYMKVADKEKGVLAVYDRPKDMSEDFDETRLQIFKITRNDFKLYTEKIEKEVIQFLKDRKKLLENPFLTEEDLMPNDITVIADGVLALENRIAEYKEIEKEYERQKQSLLEAMKDAGCKTWKTNGGYLITVVDAVPDATIEVEEFDVALLKEKHPRIYKSCSTKTTKVKKGRKEYLKITAPKGE